MKIAHLCLSCFYIDGYSYQENELVAQNVADGHDVVVVASTEVFGNDRRLAYVAPGEYMGSDRARVIRLPYSHWLPHALMRKLRVHSGVYELLEKERPDVILFHGLCGWELNAAAKFKKAHPATKLYVDSHEDFNNSAKSFLSRYILHYIYYRSIARRCLSAFEKVLCVSVDTLSFVRGFYGLSESVTELFPLGGKVQSDIEYADIRRDTRLQYDIDGNELVFVQSGKMDSTKKLLESLSAFSRIEGSHLRFFIAGHIHDDIAAEAEAVIAADRRISFLGWKTPEELRRLLCAADIYVQPGTQSATMQMSLCCRCVVILDDVPSHKPFVEGNGWLINPEMPLAQAFREAVVADLPRMSAESAATAARLLDYRALASRLYQ